MNPAPPSMIKTAPGNIDFYKLEQNPGALAERYSMSKHNRGRLMKKIGCTNALAALLTLSLSAAPPLASAEAAKMRVAFYVDKGASASSQQEFKREFAHGDDIDCTNVYGEDIRNGTLKNFDALVVPGGSAGMEARSMGTEAREEVRRFVKDGGIYMGVCAGAYLASRQSDSYLGLLPLRTLDSSHWYRVSDGVRVDVELTPLGMEVFGLSQRAVRIVYENGPIFALPETPPDQSFAVLGTFRSEVVASDGEPGVMIGAPASILCRYGRGIVLILSPHPEATPGLKLIELHALHWLYDHRATGLDSAASGSNVDKTSATRSERRPSTDAHAAEGLPPTTGSRDKDDRDDKASVASSTLNRRAVDFATSIFDQASDVSYVHNKKPASQQVVEASDGTFEAQTDCSGFISYVVHAVAPRHYKVVRKQEEEESYPQAKIWARFFNSLDSRQPHDGWLGISDWRDLQPGDIIAWEKGKDASPANHNTGHVMLVMGKPSAPIVEGGYRYFEIEVMDSSTNYHFAPERLPPKASQKHRNGLGIGCVRIIVSANDKPIGYWAGTYWGEGKKEVTDPTMSNMIRFARMTKLSPG
jgi:glutamine amidotransferase-like uncharacterized protein